MPSLLTRRPSRRDVLGSTAAALAAAAMPLGPALAQPKARYTRYNVTSAKGQEMLKSYSVAVKKLLALKPDDPRNWFRNAFVHTLDCPHGNWWFFVWHRGYLGWFEQSLREASGNPDFAIPYWDWTQLPSIPPGMFDDVLNPSNPPFDPYIKSYDAFHAYMNPALEKYWKGFNSAQQHQLDLRMMKTLPSLWSQVKGNKTDGAMFATTPHARYLTAASPGLDAATQKMVAASMIRAGLAPTEFLKFNSSKAPSHNTQPGKTTVFGIIEGNPHNKVHNNIGGVGHLADPLNFGYMADNLSPVDPVFFLHHSNMDRLWDVWTQKQKRLGLPTLPPDSDLMAFKGEPFLFYVDAQGKPVKQDKAGDYIDIGAFDYDYEPAEQLVAEANAPAAAAAAPAAAPVQGQVKGGVGSVTVAPALMQQHAAGQLAHPLVVEVTVPRPTSGGASREFDVLVGAPPGTNSADPDSPYYAGTISFFGFMKGMTGDATFVMPVPPGAQATNGALTVQVLPRAAAIAAPSSGPAPLRAPAPRAAPASVLKGVAVATW